MTTDEISPEIMPDRLDSAIEAGQEAANGILLNYSNYISGERSVFEVFLIEPGPLYDEYQVLHAYIKERVIAGLGLQASENSPNEYVTYEGVALYAREHRATDSGVLMGTEYSTVPH